jgi:hypothetical protein
LIRAAFRKAIDRLRRVARDSRHAAALTQLAHDEATSIPDERLRLIFTCCSCVGVGAASESSLRPMSPIQASSHLQKISQTQHFLPNAAKICLIGRQ